MKNDSVIGWGGVDIEVGIGDCWGGGKVGVVVACEGVWEGNKEGLNNMPTASKESMMMAINVSGKFLTLRAGSGESFLCGLVRVCWAVFRPSAAV